MHRATLHGEFNSVVQPCLKRYEGGSLFYADVFCRPPQHYSCPGDRSSTREENSSKSIHTSGTFVTPRIDDGLEVCRFSGLELNYHDGPERLNQDEKQAFNQDEKEACPRVEKEAVISMDASTAITNQPFLGCGNDTGVLE